MIALVIASLAVTSSAQAHFIWAIVQPGGKQIRMEIAESPGESLAPMLGKMAPEVKLNGIGAITDEADHMHVLAPLNGPAGGADVIYGVHGDYLVHWSAKGATSMAAAGKLIGLPAEILLKHSKAGLSAIVTKNGKPTIADVEIYLPDKKEAITARSGADGVVAIPQFKGGFLAISAIVVEAGSGNFKGVHYNEKRDLCSLTVRV